MTTVNCTTPDCICRRSLFTVDGFRGTVETKCASCRTKHVWDYGNGQAATSEVRCSNSFKGKGLGGWCGQLIAKISPDAQGEFGYRCPRCKDRHTLRIGSRVLAST